MSITVSEAKRLIAGRINADDKFDEERLLDTIHLAQEKAWNSGMWFGMMARMVVRVIDRRITLPAEYGVLQGINYQGVPSMIHPIWYQFSPNGPGTPACWEVTGIFDLQMVPTKWKIIQGEKVMAISKSKNQEDIGSKVTIQGLNSDGETIYRYYEEVDCGKVIKKSDLGEQIEIAYIDKTGAPTDAYATYNHFGEDGITNIFKSPTRGPVTILAVGPRYTRELVTMAPNQTSSDLRAYHVPEGCKCGMYVEVLARKAKPKRPQFDHEVINIDSESALINLALSVYYAFDASYDLEKSSAYLAAGLADLNGNLKENLGAAQLRPQVWTAASYARNQWRNPPAY